MPLVNYALIALLGAFALRYVVGGALFVRWGYEHGFGFNNATWRQSEVLREVARLPPDVVVYSNRPEPIFLHTGRPAAELPRRCHVNPRCDADIASLEPRMRARPSVIAYFRHVPRPTVLGEQELLALLPLKVRASRTDGTIYGLDSSR
jgi:hypothetical protein